MERFERRFIIKGYESIITECYVCQAAKINMDVIPSLNDLMQQGQARMWTACWDRIFCSAARHWIVCTTNYMFC